MSTIKTKKEMNLPELIEWGFENDIRNAVYNTKNGLSVNFSFDGKAVIGYAFSKEDTFTVEVEEEITEDTVIPKILVKSNYNEMAQEHCDSKINQFVYQYTKAIYIVNDDLTMTLIWTKEKGLVE
ncbi:hypothetical protein [Mammaliicoccus sciuri]|uniref:hypothetical protein n=1 Tax=Mammaliicoccus sciuri TaxID=1296 RepID=UPI0013308299|nr:hypothetical protein [Mammaliicoccus sciuri]